VFQTVLHNTPLIFLREAEVSHGQVDLEVLPGEFTNNFALNYTNIAALAAAGGQEVSGGMQCLCWFHSDSVRCCGQFSYSSPRYELGGSIIPAKPCSVRPPVSACAVVTVVLTILSCRVMKPTHPQW
jgi:hypothetical protein